MKKLPLLGMVALALSLAGVATASNTNPHGAFTTKFTASYDNGPGGHWTCSGERIANKNVTKDEEECAISDLSTYLPQGRTVGNPTVNINGVDWYWFSDYDGKPATTVIYVLSGGEQDGTAHVKITAQY
jgi:hypothetical protein